MREIDKEVLAKIEKLGLKPRPYVYFLARRSVFWTLAALSILLGGVSVAIAIFAAADFAATGGRGLDEMPFDDVATSLPALWLVCFALFVMSAAYGVSRTRRGYRYRPMGIAGVVVVASLALGIALQSLDMGRLTHNFLAAHFAVYKRYTYIPYAEWSRPDEGYLGGKVLSVNAQTLRLRAFGGVEWSVDVSAAENTAGEVLDEDVAIIGQRTGPREFKARSIAEFD